MRLALDGLVPAGLTGHLAGARAFYAGRGDRRGPASLAELHELRAQLVPPSLGERTVVDVGGRQVAVRVHLPPGGEVHGVHLEVPGGGFYSGPTAGAEARNAALAGSLGVAVVSVEHRLAPEDPWPAAPEDCEVAARWLLDPAPFGAAALTIGGSSAGATLAVTTLLRLRDAGLAHRVAGAVLQFGTYDLSGTTPAGRLIADEWFLDAYVGHVADRTLPDVSPVFGDLRGLPPVLLVVGAADVLLEDNLVMAARLAAAGGQVDLRVYPEQPHGFTGHPTGMARAALAGRDGWLAARLGLPRTPG